MLMSELLTIPDVMFDEEPIGLADEFYDLADEIQVVLNADSQPADGSTIYFGLDLPIGEIVEVKASVLSVFQVEQRYDIKVKVLAVDSQLKDPAINMLMNGNDKKASADGPMWGKGLKQTDGSYAVIVNLPAGVLNAEQMRMLSKITENGEGIAKLTHAQRIILLVKPDQLGTIESQLEEVGLRVGVLHHGIRNIRSCCGKLCKWASGVDAIETAIEIDRQLYGRQAKFDIKIAVSDCSRNCAESYCGDIGLIGEKGTYTIVVGGRGSSVPHRGIRLCSGVKPNEVSATIIKIIEWFEANALKKERLWKTLQRLGWDKVQGHDLSCIGQIGDQFSDGVDEIKRFTEQLSRLSAVEQLRREWNLNL
jgi:NAD(P)H-nitrite reductase large subunit